MNLVSIRMAGFINVGSGCCLNLDQRMCLTYFGKGQVDLGSDDPGEVPGRLHQQVDIDPGAVRASQLRKGEEQLQGRGLKGGHHNIGLVPGLLCFYLYHILLVPCLLPGATPCRQCLH